MQGQLQAQQQVAGVLQDEGLLLLTAVQISSDAAEHLLPAVLLQSSQCVLVSKDFPVALLLLHHSLPSSPCPPHAPERDCVGSVRQTDSSEEDADRVDLNQA